MRKEKGVFGCGGVIVEERDNLCGKREGWEGGRGLGGGRKGGVGGGIGWGGKWRRGFWVIREGGKKGIVGEEKRGEKMGGDKIKEIG